MDDRLYKFMNMLRVICIRSYSTTLSTDAKGDFLNKLKNRVKLKDVEETVDNKLKNHMKLKDIKKTVDKNRIPKLKNWKDKLRTPLNKKEIDFKLKYFFRTIKKVSCSEFYKNFENCFLKELRNYEKEHLSITDEDLRPKYVDSNKKLSSVLFNDPRITMVAKTLSDYTENILIIDKRIKGNRYLPPFYLHQKLLLNLNEFNLSRFLDLYFELPQPRSNYLKASEFEKLIFGILKLKFNGSYGSDLTKVILFFEDLIKDKFPLTPFEKSKYITCKMIKFRKDGVDEKTILNKLISLNKSVDFKKNVWGLLLQSFPNGRSLLLDNIPDFIPIDRSMVVSLIKTTNSLSELANLTELIILKKFHLDSELFDQLMFKFIEFEKPVLVLKIYQALSNILEKKSLPAIEYHIPEINDLRFLSTSYETLNKVFRMNPGKENFFVYNFAMNPFVQSRLIESFIIKEKSNRICEIIDLMIKNKVPLINLTAIEILKFSNNLHLLNATLDLVLSSVKFNSNLHKFSIKGQYDKNFLSEFVYKEEINDEMGEILRIGVGIFQNSNESEETKMPIREKLLKINNFLEFT